MDGIPLLSCLSCSTIGASGSAPLPFCRGTSVNSPRGSIGVMIIKMTRRTRRTSIKGVTFISAAGRPPAPKLKLKCFLPCELDTGGAVKVSALLPGSAASYRFGNGLDDLDRVRGGGERFVQKLIDLRTHAYLVVLAQSPVSYGHAVGIDVWNESFADCQFMKDAGGNRYRSAEKFYLFSGPDRR